MTNMKKTQRLNVINVTYVNNKWPDFALRSDPLPKGWNTELRCPGSFWSCTSLRENTEAAVTQVENKHSKASKDTFVWSVIPLLYSNSSSQ